MRRPHPDGVLVDHPCVPLVRPGPDGPEIAGPPGSAREPLTPDRALRVAAQLAATCCVLLDLDLWPGLAALRRSTWSGGEGWPRAALGGLPRPLGRLWRRLGGGEEASGTLARAARDAVESAVGTGLPPLPSTSAAPGHRLEGWLADLLDRLPSPLDPATSRSLWAWQWAPPTAPEPGELRLVEVHDEEVALRLAGAMWLRLAHRGRAAWLWRCSPEAETLPMPPVGSGATLIVVGEAAADDLAAVDRWVERHGAGALVLGRLPRGWTGEPLRVPDERVLSRLRLVGAPPERCRREAERRAGRFSPALRADREALTGAASARFARVAPPPGQDAAADPPLGRLLALDPDGVPESMLAVQSGLAGPELVRRLVAVGAVKVERGWRSRDPEPMRRDPLHALLAGLRSAGDPRRLLHAALAAGDAGELERWCRDRLDALEGGEVREVLSAAAPGELGAGIQELLAEACFGELDLGGAREAVQGLPEERRRPWRDLLVAIDPPRGSRPQPPEPGPAGRNPRCTLEPALRFLKVRAASGERRASCEALAAAALGRLQGPLRRWYELELAAVLTPDRLGDREWRKEVVGDDPRLRRRLLHRRALQLQTAGRRRAARRLFRLAAEDESSPGRLGLLLLDLGAVEADERPGEAEALHLRAYRLLTAAGFRHRTRIVVFNLAGMDTDRLRLDRAERRLEASSTGPGDPFVATEKVRLELARGREESFLRRLRALELGGRIHDPRFGEAVALLEGVAELLEGRYGPARERLAAGGEEGAQWLDLAEALRGRRGDGGAEDGWGVGLAARLVLALGEEGPDGAASRLPPAERVAPRDALAFALLERLVGRQSWLAPRWRSAAVSRLLGAGMDGWARTLLHHAGLEEGLLGGAAALLEEGRPSALGEARTAGMLAALGVEGLEVRTADRGELVWRVGAGAPGDVVTWDGLSLVPLGGEVVDSPSWRLIAAVLRSTLPARSEDLLGREEGDTGLYGISAAMETLRRELREVAPAAVTVTLRGETGVGKELAARALHRLSGRPGRFVAVNIAAVPSGLLEAELFGVVRGAFTGADRPRRGLVQAANGGTLFLDEIGDLELPLQAKLLRFLESREVRPVGADEAVEVDVRIVTATLHDLEQLRDAGRFRRDLYYRVSGSTVRIPPLRERREDIPLLRQIFAERAVQRDGLAPARWSARADEVLRRYDWPGNVRELRHVVEVALVRARGGAVTPAELAIDGSGPTADGGLAGTWEEAVTAFRRRLLEDTLRRNGGNRSAAARELGISRQTLLYHLKCLGVR